MALTEIPIELSSTPGIVDNSNATAITIDSSENVGIGTSSPSALLHVASTGSSNIKLEDTDNGFAATQLNIENGGRDFKITTPQDTIFVQGSTEAMRILDGGNVGIGASSPSFGLSVEKDNGSGYVALFRKSSSAPALTIQTTVAGITQIQGLNAGLSAVNDIAMQTSGGNMGIGMAPSKLLDLQATDNLALRFYNSTSFKAGLEVATTAGDMIATSAVDDLAIRSQSDILFSTGGNTERLRIDTSGNVGIGVTNVGAPLDIGAASPKIRLTDTGGGYSELRGNGGVMTLTADAGNTVANSAVTFETDGTERMRINDAGAGIGRTPIEMLDILSASGDARIRLEAPSGSDTEIKFFNDGAAQYTIGHDDATDNFVIGTANVDAPLVSVTKGGNLLVGTTDLNPQSSSTESGTRVGDGFIFAGRAGEVAILNRQGSDGTIADFRKDGATVGSIQAVGGDLNIGTGDTALLFVDSIDAILPATTANPAAATRDNAIDLGRAATRFDDIYATNGAIQTSDRNEKQDIEALSDAEQRVAVAAKGLLRKFRWKSSVAEKGDEARTHFGIIAQDLQAAFAAEGLDAGDYAMFINSTWTDEETGEERSRMGVRYSELLAFIIAAI